MTWLRRRILSLVIDIWPRAQLFRQPFFIRPRTSAVTSTGVNSSGTFANASALHRAPGFCNVHRRDGPVRAGTRHGGAMKKLIHPAMFTVFFGLGIACFAQNPGQRTPPSQSPQSEQTEPNDPSGGQPMTLTGCLMKGAQPDQYAITDQKSGEKVSFAAPDQLQKYLNQTVQLTGTVMSKGGQKSFQAQSLKSISPSCEGAAK
jgi:hypothetical protein